MSGMNLADPVCLEVVVIPLRVETDLSSPNLFPKL